MRSSRWTVLAILGLLGAGCAGEPPTGPTIAAAKAPGGGDTRPESEMHFLQPAPWAPPLATLSTTFVALPDRDTEGIIWYHASPGSPDSSKLARLRVPRRAVTDPTQITMSVADPARLIVEFQPAGLVFVAGRPAKLTLWYLEADHDLNQDGVIDSQDLKLERLLSIWRQENLDDPWAFLPSVLSLHGDQLESEIPGFTRYAISY